MKLNKLFAAFMLIGAVALTACHTVPEDPDQPGKPGKDTTTVDPSDPSQPGETVDWSDVTLPEGAINVAKAREIAAGLASEQVTTETYYVYGIVKKFGSKHESGMNDYGNATFYMVDNKDDKDDFEAYQVYGLDKKKFTNLDQIAVGDRVIVCCHITNYNGTYETAGKGDGYVFWSSNPKASESGTGGGEPNPEGLVGDGTEANPYTVGDLLTLNNTRTGNYFVTGYIVGQIKGGATSANGNCEFAAPFTANDNGTNTNLLIAAATGVTDQAACAFVQLPANFLREELNLIAHPENLGKEVIIYGSLEKYFGGVGVKNMTRAWIDGEEIILESGEAPAATVATVAEFNAAQVNSTVPGVYYELTGTIGGTINTQYGNFDLTDATGTVYVYGLTANYLVLSTATKANNDQSYSTLGLQAGDNITIRGVRADYNGKIEVLGAYFVRKN